jgi:hypothetical protein
MALKLRTWIGLALLACVLVALAFAPRPRGAGPRYLRAEPSESAKLLNRIRLLQNRLTWIELRDSLLPELHRAVEASPGAPVLLLDPRLGPEVRSWAEGTVRDKLSALAGLRGGVTAGVAVVVDTMPRVPGVPRHFVDGLAYLLPEATDGRSCLAVLALRSRTGLGGRGPWFWRYSPFAGSLDASTSLVGPCAYYAAFGQPGPRIRSWLESTGYSPAGYPDWAFRSDSTRPRRLVEQSFLLWLAPGLLSCAAGNLQLCRDAALPAVGQQASDGGPRGIVDAKLQQRRNLLFVRHPFRDFVRLYLSDMVLHMGRERFARFWTSEASVESAFAAAMGMPLEEWTMRWAQDQIGEWDYRAEPRLSSIALSLLIVSAFVAASAAWARRRQVG